MLPMVPDSQFVEGDSCTGAEMLSEMRRGIRQTEVSMKTEEALPRLTSGMRTRRKAASSGQELDARGGRAFQRNQDR